MKIYANSIHEISWNCKTSRPDVGPSSGLSERSSSERAAGEGPHSGGGAGKRPQEDLLLGPVWRLSSAESRVKLIRLHVTSCHMTNREQEQRRLALLHLLWEKPNSITWQQTKSHFLSRDGQQRTGTKTVGTPSSALRETPCVETITDVSNVSPSWERMPMGYRFFSLGSVTLINFYSWKISVLSHTPTQSTLVSFGAGYTVLVDCIGIATTALSVLENTARENKARDARHISTARNTPTAPCVHL